MSNDLDPDTLPFVERLKRGLEPGISMKAAAKILSRDGRPTGLPVMYRFARSGLLDTAILPGGMTTSPQAVGRLVDRLNDPARRPQQRPAAGPTPRQSTVASRRAHEQACRQLQAAGFAVPTTAGRHA